MKVLEENIVFYSQTIGKDIEILVKRVDLLHNGLEVEIKGKRQIWDLEETIWSLEKGECRIIGFK